MQFSDAIWWRHNKSNMADGRHIKNHVLAISRRHIGRSTRNLEHRWRIITIICRYSSRDQSCNFANSRWRTDAILKIALFPYLSRELSDFGQIWHTDTNFHSEHANLTKKSKFFKLKMADGRHIENGFSVISRRYFGRSTRNLEQKMKDHLPITFERIELSASNLAQT